jgi:hypothetical protein
MKILYRISDGGNNKHKPQYVYDKKLMFLHFIKIFKNHEIYVFADNVNEDTYNFLINNYDSSKIFRISLGNSSSFMHTVDFSIKNFDINDKIYFAEDDYIYTPNAAQIIEEGLDISNYATGYDHPDKYINNNEGGPNPFIEKGGELTRVLISNNTHWKLTNSTTMTVATTVKVIKEDYNVFKNGCQGNIPDDFMIFCELIQNKKRTLVSSLPSVSTHGEVQYLSKFIDWDNKFHNSMKD